MLPIVLHPSLARPASDFEPLTSLLDAEGFVSVLVSPGQGATMHELAAQVARTMDGAGVDRAHVVGHAFGNRVMRCFAADHPDRVASVTLLGAGGRVPGDAEATAALGAILWNRGTLAEVINALRVAMFAPRSMIPEYWIDNWDSELARVQHEASSATSVTEWWTAGTTAPVLIVQGRNDRMAPVDNGRQLVAELGARARLIELDDMGHAMIPEQPAQLAALVTDFVRSCDQADRNPRPAPRSYPH
jgi:pimeloyl-ACP methyl ester carboxylesterase